MGSRMQAKLVDDALIRTIWQRKLKAGLIMHTERDSQYARHQYKNVLSACDINGRMSRKGDC
jgi:putative transposase